MITREVKYVCELRIKREFWNETKSCIIHHCL